MVFSCANCESRYRIDDQLVAGRTIRFTCRKCGQAHLLSDPEQSSDPVVPVGPPQVDASRRQVAGPQPARAPGMTPAPQPRPAPAPGPTRFRADAPVAQRPAPPAPPAPSDADVVLAPSWPTPASPDDAGAGAVPAQANEAPAPASTDLRDFGEMVAGPGTPARARTPRRRGRVALIAALAFLAIAAGGAAWWWYDGFAATPADMPSVESVPVSAPVAPAPRAAATRPAPAAAPRPQPGPAPAPVPSPAPAPVVGASVPAMDTFLKQQHGRFLECKALMKSPTESTVKVRLDFAVAGDGSVEGIRVEAMDGVRDMPLVDCVRGVAQGWHFAPAGQRTTFTRILGL